MNYCLLREVIREITKQSGVKIIKLHTDLSLFSESSRGKAEDTVGPSHPYMKILLDQSAIKHMNHL